MYVFTKEEFDLLKIFHDKGAKWASRDPNPIARIEFWPTKPTKNCLDMYVSDDIMFITNANFVPSMNPGDLINLDVLFDGYCKEPCSVADETEKKDPFDSDDNLMWAAILMMLFAGTPSSNSDYYRGKYDGLKEYLSGIGRDVDGGD